MPTDLAPPPPAATPVPRRAAASRRYLNGRDFLAALGDVPIERVMFDPPPGTATERDLLHYVDGDEKCLCELVNGTLVEKPVGLWEGRIGMRLGSKMENWAEENDAGAVSGADSTLRMDGGNIRLPDVCFISIDRLPKTLAPVPSVGPDVAVEILSESNTRREMTDKLAEYFASGTRLAWYVDPPTRTVAVYRDAGDPVRVLTEADALDGEDVMPGFTLPVADLFRNVPAAG